MTAIIRPAIRQDADVVGPKLRDTDRLECLIALGLTGPEAIRYCLRHSTHALAVHAGSPKEPFALFGVAPHLPGIGTVWLLGTDEFNEHRKDLMSLTEPVLRAFQQVYPTLVVEVGEFNLKSIAYLKHFGFEPFPLMDSPASPFIHLVRT